MAGNQAQTDAQLNGASTPLKVGELEFQATTLSDKDLTELDTWIQSKYLHTALAVITPDMPEWKRDGLYKAAIDRAATLSAFTGIGVTILTSVEGMSRLAWQMIKKNHPDLTHEKVRSLLFSAEGRANIARAEINRVFKMQNMPDDLPAMGGKKGVHTERQTKRKSIRR